MLFVAFYQLYDLFKPRHLEQKSLYSNSKQLISNKQKQSKQAYHYLTCIILHPPSSLEEDSNHLLAVETQLLVLLLTSPREGARLASLHFVWTQNKLENSSYSTDLTHTREKALGSLLTRYYIHYVQTSTSLLLRFLLVSSQVQFDWWLTLPPVP